MSYTSAKRVPIYWEEEGQGAPLLMIMGLGFSLAMWRDIRPWMVPHFRTIVFDNRGIGRSSRSWAPFSMLQMAEDAVSVLDMAGVKAAAVLGFSMGGMIAQELALSFPARVHKLALACTFCGGREAIQPAREVRRVLLGHPFESRERRIAALPPILYDPHTARDRIEEDLMLLRSNPPRIWTFLAQAGAIRFWSSYERLPRIAVPTLVIHGATDRLVPPQNARILADRIPGAKLAMLPEAGHIFPTDQPDLSRQALLEFLLGDHEV